MGDFFTPRPSGKSRLIIFFPVTDTATREGKKSLSAILQCYLAPHSLITDIGSELSESLTSSCRLTACMYQHQVFGVPCITIVAPVCDRVPAGRSAFPGHAVTWSIQVEWLLAACGIHGFCKSPKQVCMHIVAWPLSSFRDDPFCLNIFMILVDFNMLINWHSNVGSVSTLCETFWPLFSP